MNHFDKRAADALAYECAKMIRAGHIGSRSGVGDALLDYLNVGGIDGPGGVPTWMREHEARTGLRDEAAGPSQEVVPLILGRVECVVPGSAVVSLLNEATGETIEAECAPNITAQAGLSEGDEFACEVVDGETRLVRLEPKPVSGDRIAEILKEVAL